MSPQIEILPPDAKLKAHRTELAGYIIQRLGGVSFTRITGAKVYERFGGVNVILPPGSAFHSVTILQVSHNFRVSSWMVAGSKLVLGRTKDCGGMDLIATYNEVTARAN